MEVHEKSASCVSLKTGYKKIWWEIEYVSEWLFKN